jgi:hypothetical protein
MVHWEIDVSTGNYTYFDSVGGCSVIEYIIASENLLEKILYFNVLPPNEFSDHCIIRSSISCTYTCNVKDETEKGTIWPGKFK